MKIIILSISAILLHGVVSGTSIAAEPSAQQASQEINSSAYELRSAHGAQWMPLHRERKRNRVNRGETWMLVANEPGTTWEPSQLPVETPEWQLHLLQQPDVPRRVLRRWERWSRRARVLPWVLLPVSEAAFDPAGSTATSFEFEPGADLDRDDCPRVDGKGFLLTAQIEELAADGVIAAQGGLTDGYALYLKRGVLTFATRHRGKLTVVPSQEPLPARPMTVSARLATNGTITLCAGERILAEGRAPGPLRHLPLDGLQIGADSMTAVGDYRPPFPFTGKIRQVKLTIETED